MLYRLLIRQVGEIIRQVEEIIRQVEEIIRQVGEIIRQVEEMDFHSSFYTLVQGLYNSRGIILPQFNNTSDRLIW